MKVWKFNQIGKRETQQDQIWVSENRRLFIVCDGVGGAGDGETASRLVVDFFKKKTRELSPIEFLEQFPSLMAGVAEKLRVQSVVSQKSLSTTIALAYILNDTVYLYHLGDSRIFFINRADQFHWISKDHSLIQDLYEIGVIDSEDEMKKHPMRNRITKALSSEQDLPEEDFHIYQKFKLKSGSMIFLCTDGVLENFTNRGLLDKFLDTTQNPEEIYSEIKATCLKKSKDNNSCIFIVY